MPAIPYLDLCGSLHCSSHEVVCLQNILKLPMKPRILRSSDPTKVEKDKACQALIHHEWEDSCVFSDIRELVSNPPANTENWSPNKLNLKKKAYCTTHNMELLSFIQINSEWCLGCVRCELRCGPQDADLAVVGAPCILFSRWDFNIYSLSL